MAVQNKKSLTIAEAIGLLESHAPSSTAESWDNVGLLVGDLAWQTSSVVVAIDLTTEVLKKAKQMGSRLVVTHHPCIFPKSKGLTQVVNGPNKAGLVFDAVTSGIAVAAYHTNFDRCALEVVEVISQGLGLTPRGRLLEHAQGVWVKLCVFVPQTHLESVRLALLEAGAGHIGNYDCCTFGVEGMGTFRGAHGTHPFMGRSGHLETVREVRLETIVPRGLEKQVLAALRLAHPYEEIAYDFYPVEQAPPSVGLVKGVGYGFWGEFKKPKSFPELLVDVRTLFQVNGFLLTEPAPKKVRRIAFAAGKGSSVVKSALEAGCDLMITGEVGYHDAIAASIHQRASKMAVMELGHRESERFFVETMRGWLTQAGLKAFGLHVKTQKFWNATSVLNQ